MIDTDIERIISNGSFIASMFENKALFTRLLNDIAKIDGVRLIVITDRDKYPSIIPKPSYIKNGDFAGFICNRDIITNKKNAIIENKNSRGRLTAGKKQTPLYLDRAYALNIIIFEEIYPLMSIKDFDLKLSMMINKYDSKLVMWGFSKYELSKIRLKESVGEIRLLKNDEIIPSLSKEYIREASANKQIDFDSMTDGISFENFCRRLLADNGFESVRLTPNSGDQGIDILCEKDEVKYGIQCKCYSNSVGNKAVQEAFAGAKYYNCHVPVVLSNAVFTKSAREAASKMNVLLWGRERLLKMINSK